MGRNITINQWRSFLCIAATSLCSAANVQAQTGLSLGRLPLPKLPPSQSDRNIPAWTVDPLMTPEQEQSILRELRKPCPFVWDSETTLQMVCDDLGEIVPTRLDTRSIVDMGLTPDVPLDFPKLVDPSITNDSATLAENGKQEVNWFGESKKVDRPFTFDPRGTATGSTDPFGVSKNAVAKPAEQAWWKQISSPRETRKNRISLAAYLIQGIEDLDLVLEVRAGTLTMTTPDAAETRLMARVYDVTRLFPKEADMRGRRYQSYGPYPLDGQSLIDSIHINIYPETWEAQSGPSTMSVLHVHGRKMLVATTMTYQHWAIMQYLEILNTATRGR